jgi:hypothetical protein
MDSNKQESVEFIRLAPGWVEVTGFCDLGNGSSGYAIDRAPRGVL